MPEGEHPEQQGSADIQTADGLVVTRTDDARDALRCRYGDAEGAKRELSVLKDVSGLRGADVDPEWRSCK